MVGVHHVGRSAAASTTSIGPFDEVDAQQRGLRLLAARGVSPASLSPQRSAARALPRPHRQPVGERRADAARHPARLHQAPAGSSPTARARSPSSTPDQPASRRSGSRRRRGWRYRDRRLRGRARAPGRAARPPRRCGPARRAGPGALDTSAAVDDLQRAPRPSCAEPRLPDRAV